MKKPYYQRIALDAGQTRAVRFLASSVSVDAGTKTSVVTLTRVGRFYDPRYGNFEITPKMLSDMIGNFESGTFGQDIMIDRAHDANQGAAGTINRLFLDGTKLRAEVAWTVYGLELIQDKGYRYMSAEYHENFTENEEPYTEHGPTLLGAALCVRPCIKNLDRVELSADDKFEGPNLIAHQLAAEINQEQIMEKLLKALREALEAKKMKEATIVKWLAAAKQAAEGNTDENKLKQLFGNLQAIALSQMEAGNEPGVINLTVETGQQGEQLTMAQVQKMLNEQKADETKQLADKKTKLDANVKAFTDAITGAKELSDDTKQKLLKSQDLITSEMTTEQVTSLAANQLILGNELEAQKKLSSMGFTGHMPGQGSVMIASGTNVNAMKLATDIRKQLKLTSAFSNKKIHLADEVNPFVDNVLQLFDNQYGHRLEQEYKVLSGDEGNMVDVDLPFAFRREVIRESLHDMTILSLVATRTDPGAQATTQVPYEERKTHNAVNNGIVHERGAIPTAGVTQKMDLAYVNAMKIAFNVSNELMHFSRVSNINWDAWGRHVATCSRILRELVVRRLANEMLRVSDSFSANAVSSESIAAELNGSNSVIKTTQFPIVRPHQNWDLAGNAVGAASNPIVVTVSGSDIAAYDGSGNQASGTYWTLVNANLGYIGFVDETGAAVTPTSGAATISYSASTNVSKFDIDLPTDVVLEKHLNGLLRLVGARKALMKDDRYESPDFMLMSNTLNDTITNADEFIYQNKRNAQDTNAMGDLEMVKALPAFATNAPGIDLGDERILMGQRGTTTYSIAKAFALSEMVEGRDADTGQLNGTKEAYGEEFNSIHTPKPITDRYTSILVYSAGNR